MSNENYANAFIEEAWELLAELETYLLELEEAPEDKELISSIFRSMHTLKGSGGMFGFDKIVNLTHTLETLFDMIRSDKLGVTKEIIDITLKARDLVGTMLEEATGGNAVDDNTVSCLIDNVKKIINGNVTDPAEAGAETIAVDDGNGNQDKKEASGEVKPPVEDDDIDKTEKTFWVNFEPDKDTLECGTDPLLLLNEISELGKAGIFAYTNNIPDLDAIDPHKCYTKWDITVTTNEDENSIKDVFIFVEDDAQIEIKLLDSAASDSMEGEGEYKKLGEVLIDRKIITPDQLKHTLDSQMKIGELLVSQGLVSSDDVKSALLEQNHVRQVKQKRTVHKSGGNSSIKVASDKLDSLVDQVGELVIVQARLSQYSIEQSNADLVSITEEVERLTGELRDSTLSIRMLTIGTTFSRFKRLVRDLSHDLGKQVEMVTEGADTELDKTVIDRLNDPMVHLIRNCMDHGIEPAAVRQSAGKPAQGTIHISATHAGSDVLIKIKDDGAGLNADAIRNKAIEKGIIQPDTVLNDRELYSLIFEPGFSTSKTVSNVSGRGVGMDVVKQTIDSLHGSISIDTEQGRGTTISIKLPLTLAIIEGLQVVIGEDVFVLPLPSVEECIELTRDDIDRMHGRHITNVRGEIVPYISLRSYFGLATDHAPEIEQIVITKCNGKRVGFLLDHVIGAKQIVIKSLGNVYKGIKGISGATILGDGTVALILDANQLMEQAEKEETTLVA